MSNLWFGREIGYEDILAAQTTVYRFLKPMNMDDFLGKS
jgi:hypothetical protein